ncbi:hypothetical protein GYMLUDRAFT_691241 [Collybiopsis luxurians FD-317 M1]|uniref:Secreted protein n=1 Tax=Collybiopsis luxurians FD-317 M1 TaxID=944289 RepID=A0A0D0B5A6_9AGAR|nr:hypothetical protein GYMLUDRAFT_691241 [Collybiopsis luxurians FD-317 M1]
MTLTLSSIIKLFFHLHAYAIYRGIPPKVLPAFFCTCLAHHCATLPQSPPHTRFDNVLQSWRHAYGSGGRKKVTERSKYPSA